MKKIIFESLNTALLVDAVDRMPGPGEVRVKNHFTALSAGTDRACITGEPVGPNKNAPAGFPSSPGYAGSGIVEQVGEGVTDLKPGDRVMIHGGGHQEYSTVGAGHVVKLPSDQVSLMDASFTIIAGFSLAAVRKARIELGESCMVVGLGLLGLYAVQYAKLVGAMPIIAVDYSKERRELALKLGADYAMNPADDDYAQRVMELTGGKGVNTVIEVTGSGAALNQTLPLTAKFGRVVLLGCTRRPTEVYFYHDVHYPGIELIGAHSGARPQLESRPGCWTEMDDCRVTLNYLAAGRLNFRDMIAEIHPPEDAPQVYNRLVHDRNFPIGVVFDWRK